MLPPLHLRPLAAPCHRVWGPCHSGFPSTPSCHQWWVAGSAPSRGGMALFTGWSTGRRAGGVGSGRPSLNSSHCHFQSLRCQEEGSPRHDALNSGKRTVSLLIFFFSLHNIPISSLNVWGRPVVCDQGVPLAGLFGSLSGWAGVTACPPVTDASAGVAWRGPVCKEPGVRHAHGLPSSLSPSHVSPWLQCVRSQK